jgi:hypothetical protein
MVNGSSLMVRRESRGGRGGGEEGKRIKHKVHQGKSDGEKIKAGAAKRQIRMRVEWSPASWKVENRETRTGSREP